MNNYGQQGRVRLFGLSAALAVGVAVLPAPAQAGFFDQLFGGGTPEPAQPSYNYEAPQPTSPDVGVSMGPKRAKKKTVAREIPPVRQKTTSLMLDKTLHVGDAVMMKDGLHIYSGGDGSKHTAKQFVPIDHSRALSAKAKSALIAMDTTRVDPLKKAKASDTLASGRSAAVGAPISAGFRITDARGQSIRYVGP